jgi:hypothetical protein
VSPIRAKVDPAWIWPPEAAGPMMDANCRCIFDGTPMRGASRRGESGAMGRGVTGTQTHKLPSFGNLTMVTRLYSYVSGIRPQVRDYNGLCCLCL